MPWKMIGKPQVVKATQSLIERFFKMEPAPNDRPLNERRQQKLKSMIDLGEFRTCEWASARCKETKTEYRVNGKHTSTILASMNGTAPKDLHIIVEQYECDNLEDVARLYCTFDSRVSARTSRDINRIFSATILDVCDLPSWIIDKAVAGLAFSKWEETCGAHGAEEKASLMLDAGDFICWLYLLTEGKDSKHLRRSPAIAAMFQTFCKAQKASTEFWTLVRDASGPNNGSPDRKLNKMLLTCVLGRGPGSRPGNRIMKEREMFVKCLHAWNAWRKGETTDLKYYATAKTPAVV